MKPVRNNPEFSRRELLFGAGTLAGPYAQRTATQETDSSFFIEQSPDWGSFRGNAANTGVNSDTIGPRVDLRERWSTGVEGAHTASPIVISNTVFVAGHRPLPRPTDGPEGLLVALDAATGEKQWSVYTQRTVDTHGIAAGNDIVYAGGRDISDYLLQSFKMDGGIGIGQFRWTNEEWRNYYSADMMLPPIVYNGFIYQPAARPQGPDDATLRVYDLRTGELEWALETQTAGLPAISDGSVYRSEGDELVARGTDNGELQWSEPGYRFRSVSVRDGVLYGLTEERLIAFDLDSRTERWVYSDITSPVTFDRPHDEQWRLPPTVLESTVCVGENTTLHMLDAQTGEHRWQKTFETAINTIVATETTVYALAGSFLYTVDVDGGTVLDTYEWEFMDPQGLAIAGGTVYVAESKQSSRVAAIESPRTAAASAIADARRSTGVSGVTLPIADLFDRDGELARAEAAFSDREYETAEMHARAAARREQYGLLTATGGGSILLLVGLYLLQLDVDRGLERIPMPNIELSRPSSSLDDLFSEKYEHSPITQKQSSARSDRNPSVDRDRSEKTEGNSSDPIVTTEIHIIGQETSDPIRDQVELVIISEDRSYIYSSHKLEDLFDSPHRLEDLVEGGQTTVELPPGSYTFKIVDTDEGKVLSEVQQAIGYAEETTKIELTVPESKGEEELIRLIEDAQKTIIEPDQTPDTQYDIYQSSFERLSEAEELVEAGEYEEAESAVEEMFRIHSVEKTLHQAARGWEQLETVLSSTIEDGLDTERSNKYGLDTYIWKTHNALEDGNISEGEEIADTALKEVQSQITTHLEQELQILNAVQRIDDQIFAGVDSLPEIPDDEDIETQIQTIKKIYETKRRGLDQLSETLPELETRATKALEQGEFSEAKEISEALEKLVAELASPLNNRGYEDLASKLQLTAEEVKTDIEEAESEIIDQAETNISKAEDARSTGDDWAAENEYVPAVQAYTESVHRWHTASHLIEAVDQSKAEWCKQQAQSVEEDMRSVTESALEDSYDILPDNQFPGKADIEQQLQEAAQKLDRDEYESAAETVSEAMISVRQSLNTHISETTTQIDELQSEATALKNEQAFEDAIEKINKAASIAEELEPLLTIDLQPDADTSTEDIHEKLQHTREEIRDAAEAFVNDRQTAASDAMSTADTAFDNDEYKTAKENYAQAKAHLQEAIEVTDSLELSTGENLNRQYSQVAERIEYAKLAKYSARLQEIETTVANNPHEALDSIDEITKSLTELEITLPTEADSTPLRKNRDQLISEARRRRINARIEIARRKLVEAEDFYDQGNKYEARDHYRDAESYLSELHDDISNLKQDVSEPEALQRLLEICNSNIEFITQELAGVTSVAEIDQNLQRIGDQDDTGSDEPSLDQDDRQPSLATYGMISDTGMGTVAPVQERVNLIGEGGYARVWRVILEDGREAALKIPKYDGTVDSRDSDRFLTQAEEWSKRDEHPNIVTVYDYGYGAEPWMLMEYMPDGSLLTRVGDVSLTEALDYIIAIADALTYARGVAHLDIKPENILFDGDTPKLADWGLAKVAFARNQTDTSIGMTPPYAAPEQIERQRGDQDYRTDIYQLGVTAYQTIAGRLPYPPDAPESLEMRILDSNPTPLTELADVPPAVNAVILKAMAVERDARYEAPIKFRDALREVLDEIVD